MLKLKASTCIVSCRTLEVSDVSGNIGTSSTGWGSPNLAKGDVTKATLQILAPGQSTYTSFTVTSQVAGSSTSASEFLLQNIVPSDLSLTSTQFPSGQYELIYTVEANEDEFSPYIYKTKFIVACQEQCCVDKMWAKVAAKSLCCDCAEFEYTKKTVLASSLLEALYKAGECMSLQEVTDLIARIKRICLLNDCGCK